MASSKSVVMQERETLMHNHISDVDFECPAEIRVLLGPAPVLSSRSRLEHELLFKNFTQLVKPRDVVEWIFIRECTDNRSEVSWLKRLRNRLVQTPLKNYVAIRWRELSLANNAEIEKLRQKRTVEVESKINQLRGTSDHVKAETDRLYAEANRELKAEIEAVQFETHKKFKEQEEPIIKSEITDADVFEFWGADWEWVSKRIAILNKEFANSLEEIDQWRHGGLGERLCKRGHKASSCSRKASWGRHLTSSRGCLDESAICSTKSASRTQAADRIHKRDRRDDLRPVGRG
jgi:hypothetical protein